MRRIQDHFPPLMKQNSAISDAELLATFRRQRDETSFREIVLRHGRMVQSAVRQVLGSHSDFEDVVQATFLALVRRPASIKKGQSLGSWLYGVAHRLALQHQRSSGRRLRREQQSEARLLDETTRSVATAELKTEISEALEAIPERYRQAIIYCYLEERSPEEAAKLLDCPVGTLWSRLARGREKLRTILARRGWNLELPAIALVLSATEDSLQAGTHLWRQLQELVQWQPQATILTPLKPIVAGLLLKEKVMFSLRSVMSVVVFVGLLACGAGLSINALAQTAPEPPAKAQNATVDIKPQQYPADWKGRLSGTVTAAHSGQPLAGATISVSLAGVAEEYRLVQATSGTDGKYTLPLPEGHAWLFGLYAPPGYYTRDQKTHSQVAAREGQDEVFDFKLYPGMPWNIQFTDGPVSAKKPPRFIANTDVPPGTISAAGSSLMVIGNLQGKAVITFPRATERYRITSFWPESGLSRGASAFLEIDGQFDPQQIAGPPEAVPDGKGQRVKDRAGRVATLEDAEFVVEGQNVTIRMKQKPESKEPNLVFQGTVLDEQNKPIEGAEAILAFHSKTGGAMSEYNAKTNAEGLFKIEGPNRSEFRAQRSLNVSAMIRKKGYAGKETEKLLLATAREKGMGDFGIMSLKHGLTLRGRVVDEDGKPVHGAVVTNLTNYFLYSHLQCRTAADGRFTMSGLSEGKQSLEVQYGEKSAIVSSNLNAKSDEIKIEVRPRRGMGMRQANEDDAKIQKPTEPKKMSWNLTPPTKEPKYQHAPKYSLLVFGRNQETRVWLVLDGEVLYVDCHGNGDLTAPECRITATQGEVKLGNPGFYKDIVSYTFDLNKLVGAGKGQMRLDLFRRDEKFVPKIGIDIKNQEQWQENRWERAIINRKSAGSGLYFVSQPVDAQVTNFDGALSLSKKYRSEQIFERGSGGSDFPLHIGSFGRPCKNGSYSVITTLPLNEVPADLHLIARVEFPAKVPGAEPIIKVFELKERCCGDTFHGTVIVPAEAGAGNAKVIVLTSPWPGHEVEQGKFEVPIKD